MYLRTKPGDMVFGMALAPNQVRGGFMKTVSLHILKSGFSALALVSLVSACGIKQLEDNTNSVSSSGGDRNNTVYIPGTDRASDWDRSCTKPILSTNITSLENALEKYFFSSLNTVPAFPGEVKDIEPPANWCLRIWSGGQRASFRIEYEDHYGGDWYEMDAYRSSNLYSASSAPILFHLSLADDKIDVIFLDSQGFTQIVGSKAQDGLYTATLKFANLPSQANYVASYVQSQIDKCKSGEWTVAMCWGYNFPPTYQDDPQDPLTIARGMLNGGSGAETGTIGTMRFRLSDILN